MDTKFSKTQAFWFAAINYLGVLIGTISTLFIYPKDKEMLGVFRFVDSFAQILYPIMVLGVSTSLLHFQPRLSHLLQRKLFSFSMLSVLLMSVLCGFVVLFISEYSLLKNKEYLLYGYFIAVCLAFVDVLKRQATNIQRLAVPTFYEKIVPKIVLPVIFLLLISFGFSVSMGMFFYVLSFAMILVLVLVYLLKHFDFVLSIRYTDLFAQLSFKEYYRYSMYAFCASLGSFFAFRIDAVMIPQFLGNEANGDYSIGVNLANALMIPATGIFALYSPIISEKVKVKDWCFLKEKYSQVAKNLYFLGILLFGNVLLGMHDFFLLLPTAEKLITVIPVLYVLGFNVLLNMSTGFNTEIIAYSVYYKFNLIAILLLATLNFLLNFFILSSTNFGIMGVALASLFSMVCFNLFKLIFIYHKFGMLPFDKNYAKTVLLSIVLLVVAYFLPLSSLPLYGFIFKCLFFSVSFSFVIYYKNWVPEWNNLVNNLLRKIR